MFIDSHCHLDFPVFDHQRERILQICQQHKISALVVPGVSAEHWQVVAVLSGLSCSLPCFRFTSLFC